MPPARVEKCTWSLIFGGLLTLGLGVAVLRNDAALGWALIIVGTVGAVAGAVLIWVRSRMKDAP